MALPLTLHLYYIQKVSPLKKNKQKGYNFMFLKVIAFFLPYLLKQTKTCENSLYFSPENRKYNLLLVIVQAE